jgi:hypothetical protein
MFTPKTIKKIVEKIKTENTKIVFNLNHDDERKIEAVLVGDFIVSEKMGMQAPEWHQKLSDGSWFGFVKIKDKEDYEFAKENLTGFSVEGIFDQIKYKDVEEEIINEIKSKAHIMKKIETALGSDVASKLKKLIFGEHEEAPKEEKEQEMKGEAVLADGTIVAWQGELAEGTPLFVVTEEGQTPAPDGRHELSDGSYVTTAEGVVTEIESASAEEAPEEMAAEVPQVNVEEIAAQVMEAMEEKFAALEAKLVAHENKSSEINKKMFSMVEELAKMEQDKADKFSKQDQTLSMAQRKLAALATLK